MTQTSFLTAETSIAALAAQSDEKLSADKAAIVSYVRSQREHGATRWEISKATDIQYSTVCGRANELCESGVLVNSGRKRKTGTGAMAFVLLAKE